MRFQLTQDWPLGDLTALAGTVFDFAKPDKWTDAAQGKGIPLTCVCLDEEAWHAQLAAYPDSAHLLRGDWR